MNITNIKALAGRTFNHPYEQYSNFKHSVLLEASLSPGEDADAATKALQAKAEAMAEEHKTNLLRSVQELREMSELEREVSSLEESIKRGQERVTEIRKRFPEQTLLAAGTHDSVNSDPVE